MVKYDSYTYDEMTDSIFLSFSVEYEYKEVIELNDDLLLEIDTNFKPRSFEILNASEKFKTETQILKDISSVEMMMMKINDEYIEIRVILGLSRIIDLPLFEKIKNVNNILNIDNNFKITA